MKTDITRRDNVIAIITVANRSAIEEPAKMDRIRHHHGLFVGAALARFLQLGTSYLLTRDMERYLDATLAKKNDVAFITTFEESNE